LGAGGAAWTWRASGSKAQDRALRQQLKAAAASEYTALAAEAKAADGDRRTAQRLRRTLHEIERRDYAAPKERDDARRAVQRLMQSSGMAERAR
jgi:hypothetical protein